ncbi:hypothetical protein EJF18_20884 [Clavispora lusitaniae]|uniref:Alpha/beta hydrolase n=2 Tax=Clavispora lusitaniae TaxID=36911 RepID=A0AA91Q327_CLALS|nr:hypothetical protein A9F13_02g01980 [Clavispora lusitaniae]QFZ26963.1 hypothetical protein EJF14_20884 [Clavispora lusitaniae]QFZ32631.1 hypothetical protein EJF16_20884 [Clavispora lusitaniae]QFZ38300.1 hypothetical protein EJF15_20884 [Clavispora lusitaniae]QFZ43983.1 hypothetical protein EJF18_20884 [Clavispora lusitaniae]
MIQFNVDLSKFSKKTFSIGGITVYVYNSDAIAAYVKSLGPNPDLDSIQLNFLYLVHHRSGDYTYTEATGVKILENYASEIPLIPVTFDIRNHGARTVDKSKNSSWKSGNDTHAMDMMSCIEGTIYDLKLIMDYLPSYLNLDALLHESWKERDLKFKFCNILSGYSVGAHVVIRFANRYADLVSIINPNIGCSDLTSLLVNRLKGTSDYSKKLLYFNYEELGLTEEQKQKYPESLHLHVSREDIEIMESFPFRSVKMFATFYSDDPIVPSKISTLWADTYANSNDSTELYYEEGAIHDITEEMVLQFVKWLSKQLS